MRSSAGGSSWILGIVITLAPIFLACHTYDTFEILWERDSRVLYSVDTDEALLALTIDDGPDPIATQRILEVLEAHGATATFFLIADRVSEHGASVQAIVNAGHEIANHGGRDLPAVGLGPEAFERDLVHAHDVLAPYGVVPWYRPGSGWYDDWMFEILDREGYRMALGTVYPLDAEQSSVWLTTHFVLWRAEQGSVIILHDGGNRGLRTASALDRILPELKLRGLRAVTLSELVASAVPSSEDSGKAGQ
jgi:peptidoglycan/xylan/chitin deacetylase (PgdA/CDA1 family)